MFFVSALNSSRFSLLHILRIPARSLSTTFRNPSNVYKNRFESFFYAGKRTGLPGMLSCQKRFMFIQTEVTPNTDSLKFKPGTSVMTDGRTAEFNSPREAMVSPLALRLFRIDGVTSVFYGPDFITITKDQGSNWAHIKPDIFAAIMDAFTAQQPLFSDSSKRDDLHPNGNTILDSDSETVQMIKELLETRIRPTIQEDGGDVEFRGFDEKKGTVFLKLLGACKTCDSSVVTLKNGIENMMKHYIPEVKAVEQDLDEAEKVSQQEFEKLEKKLRDSTNQ